MEWENIKDKIYPWIKRRLNDSETENDRVLEIDLPEIEFFGDLVVLFVIDVGENFEVLQRSEVPENISDEELYEIACQNLARDVRFQVVQANYGGYGILADGDHEAGALCLGFIWDCCVDLIGEDLIVAVPAKDTVLITGKSQSAQLEDMKKLASDILSNGNRTLTRHLFLYSIETKSFSVFE